MEISSSSIVNILTLRYDQSINPNLPKKTWKDFEPIAEAPNLDLIENSILQEVENKLIEDRHYTSTNRWVPTKEIKNGYVVNSRHTTLVSDAAALDMIVF